MVLPFNSNTKFLGISIDSKPSWDIKIDEICQKLNRAYYCIRKLKNSLDTAAALVQTYYSMAYCYIAYNVILWDGAIISSGSLSTKSV